MDSNMVKTTGGWRRGEGGVVALEPSKRSRPGASVEGGGVPRGTPPDSPGTADDGPPEGSIDQVLAWVDADPARAHQAYVAEQLSEKPRSTLLDRLDTIRGA